MKVKRHQKGASSPPMSLISSLSREGIIKEYLNTDVLFLHLNDYEAFKKVLPSKIFEYAALGKPIWAGVSGYAAQFLHGHVRNAVVFHPCDAKEAIQVFDQLEIRDAMAENILGCIAQQGDRLR